MNADERAKYLKECVTIYPECISEEFVRVPSDLAYWNNEYANALREANYAKLDLDVLEAELYVTARETLIDTVGKATDSMVESAVHKSPAYREARQRLAQADAEKARMFGVLDAVRSKKEMLISLGAQLRAEMGGDPLIRERVAGARELRQQNGG